MKKTILVVTAAAIAFNLYAFDTASTLKPAVGVKDYTKTDYTITEKFGDYYRSPKAKYVHVFDAAGKHIEATELTSKDALVDRLVYSYDTNGRLTNTISYDSEGKLSWKQTTVYDAAGNKTEESTFNASDMLVNKSIISGFLWIILTFAQVDLKSINS